MTNSLILYVGGREAGQALADLVEPRGGFVYQPENMMQALGMYITYFPDVVVIDRGLAWGEAVFEHLRSVGADPIILLGDGLSREASVYVASPQIGAENLTALIARIARPTPALQLA